MSIDKVLQATLLLTVFFNKREVGKVKPLTPLEYGRFAAWLHQQGLSPADLLNGAGEILSSWVDPKKKITVERVNELLVRGASMGFALENWHKQGVWMLSRASADYPRTVRKHLGDARPPVLFGVGNQSLLNRPGMGFVGSRSPDDSDAQFTKKLACLAVDQGYIVISGGAKGIDQTAMEAALDHGGMSVGVLADSLLKASTTRIYRTAIQDERLVLISPYYPEAGWSQGNAMGRNKYIYTLSQAVVAVRSDFEKGGTWAGAVENQKKNWVPLMVRDSNHKGNQELIKQGAMPIDDGFNDFAAAIESSTTNQIEQSAKSAMETPVENSLFNESKSEIQPVEPKALDDQSAEVKGLLEEKQPLDEQEPPALKEQPERQPKEQPPEAPPVKQSTGQDSELESPEQVAVPPGNSGSKPKESTSPNPVEHTVTDLERLQNRLNGTPLEHYSELFGVFLRALTEMAQIEPTVTPANLQEKFPELPVSVIKKWLAELEQHSLLVREGRKLSYTLPAPDFFQ